MTWRAIGQSTIGTAHLHGGKNCEDALVFRRVKGPDGDVLIACASDGAGSAQYAEQASQLVTEKTVSALIDYAMNGYLLRDVDIIALAEELYEELTGKANLASCPINEFSCTYLGCFIQDHKALFFQIGDGAIVRDDGGGAFTPVWWPQNGEYSNTTAFLVDDPNFPNLKIITLDEEIREVAIFTDGLQNLILNTESVSVHQPFFANLFQWLRKARTGQEVQILQQKLVEYLSGSIINSRTDDDKTLFLATRYLE
jgi:hypothetical protein